MQALNDCSIKEIKKLWKHSRAEKDKIPYAVRLPRSVVVTNNVFLVEWPMELVDFDSEKLAQLIDNGDMPHARVASIIKTPWVKLMAPNKDFYRDVDEVEPTDEELAGIAETGLDAVVFGADEPPIRQPYNMHLLEILMSACTQTPSLYIYCPPESTEDLNVLLIQECGKIRGALSNITLKQY